MKCYAVFSEGVNIYKDQRVFKTKRSAQRNLESFIACTIGHDAQIKEVEKPSYFELEQEIQKFKADREELENDQVRHIELLREEYAKLIQKLEEQNKLLTEALSFYANTLSWENIPCESQYNWFRPIINIEEDCSQVDNDEWCSYGGKRARKVLDKIKEMK